MKTTDIGARYPQLGNVSKLKIMPPILPVFNGMRTSKEAKIFVVAASF
jgi:hypothetical protein